MAKAEVKDIIVSREVTEVLLRLTPQEAASIWLVSMKIGGASSGIRGYTDQVGKALKDVGVFLDYSEYDEDLCDAFGITGAIRFSDDSAKRGTFEKFIKKIHESVN